MEQSSQLVNSLIPLRNRGQFDIFTRGFLYKDDITNSSDRKCIVGKSKFLEGQLGLIAFRDIEIGELITIYPPHWFLEQKDGKTKVLVYQSISPEISGKYNVLDYAKTYSIAIDSIHLIVGCPEIINNHNLLAHMCNDYRGLSKNYNALFFRNDPYQLDDNNPDFIALKATRKIKRGEEILTCYGEEFIF